MKTEAEDDDYLGDAFFRKWNRMKRSKDKAERIVAAILDDVTDRRGWRQEWEGFDVDVRLEIVERWLQILRRRSVK